MCGYKHGNFHTRVVTCVSVPPVWLSAASGRRGGHVDESRGLRVCERHFRLDGHQPRGPDERDGAAGAGQEGERPFSRRLVGAPAVSEVTLFPAASVFSRFSCLITVCPRYAEEPADWEKELQQELQEYEVVSESDNRDDQWDQEIEKMLQADS